MAPFLPETAKISKQPAGKSNNVGSYCFTRSANRCDSLGAKRDASSCTSYIKESSGNRQRRVLSDITNDIRVSPAASDDDPKSNLLQDNHHVTSTPRKHSLEADSHNFSAKAARYSESSQPTRPSNASKPAALSKCHGKSMSRTGGPVAESMILKAKVPPHSKKKLLLARDDGVTPMHCARSPPSKLSSLRKKILEKVSGKSILKPKCQIQRRSISKDKEFRRLSLVLRSEQELLEKSLDYEKQVHLLQQQCQNKESEIESVRNVGKMLGKLCVNQAEELKALKGMFPPTLREVVQLRDLCQKQERELRDARTVVPSLQEQVKLLTAQLDLLADDIEKVKAARLARRALTCDASAVVGSNKNTQEVQRKEEDCSIEQTGKVNGLLTGNLENMMGRLNLATEKDISLLEDKCVKAFQNLGFSNKPSGEL